MQFCVQGRAREDGHRRSKGKCVAAEVPTIAMDYCFMGKDDKKVATILVVKDSESKAMKAYNPESKGSCN